MLAHLRPAFVATLAFTAITGLAYPYAITGIAQVAFPLEANGSLINRDGEIVGSQLIGQAFASDKYFWSRPSATSPDAYNAAASSGSNLGPTSAKLKDRVAGDVDKLKKSGIQGDIPADAATASGSGLDPHISPDFAKAQIARIAKARGKTEADITALVSQFTEGRLAGVLGEPRVNVLELNIALDQI